MKRWNFGGLRAIARCFGLAPFASVRPVSVRTRARCSRARRWPATWAMSVSTTLNLQVVRTDVERGLIMVKGAVPGSKGGWVLVR